MEPNANPLQAEMNFAESSASTRPSSLCRELETENTLHMSGERHMFMNCDSPAAGQGHINDRVFKFSALSNERHFVDFGRHKKMKQPRDPMSHRLIEKRRRDRMNNCLADLSRLIPTTYLKQGQGRIEKTEIVEMAIKYIRQLQNSLKNEGKPDPALEMPPTKPGSHTDGQMCGKECGRLNFYYGFRDCMDEVAKYLVDESSIASNVAPSLWRYLENVSKPYNVDIESNMDTTKGYPNPASWKNNKHDAPYIQTDSSGISVSHDESFTQDSGVQISNLSPAGKQIESDTAEANMRANLSDTQSFRRHGSGSEINMTSSVSYGSSLISVPIGGNECEEEDNTMDADPNAGDLGEKVVYNFKKNIKQRFTADQNTNKPQWLNRTNNDSSSTSSQEEAGSDRTNKIKSKSPVSYAGSNESSQYPGSGDTSSNGYSSNGQSIASSSSSGLKHRIQHASNHELAYKKQIREVKFEKDKAEQDIGVPGFAMHPSATHYIPITVHLAYLKQFLGKRNEENIYQIYHPISIPVKLGGPVIPPPVIS